MLANARETGSVIGPNQRIASFTSLSGRFSSLLAFLNFAVRAFVTQLHPRGTSIIIFAERIRALGTRNAEFTDVRADMAILQRKRTFPLCLSLSLSLCFSRFSSVKCH